MIQVKEFWSDIEWAYILVESIPPEEQLGGAVRASCSRCIR